jgi:SET domain-containing protein
MKNLIKSIFPPVNMEHVKVKESSIHNKGVFARKDIKKGTKVIEYVGEKITKAESDRRADRDLERNAKNQKHGAVYLFTLNKKYDIDGNVSWNPAKYINHSCNPNCETDIIKGKIWIIALKDIKKGEEITYNYGYDYDNFLDHPCRCKSHNCIGYIADEDHWPKIKKKLKKK